MDMRICVLNSLNIFSLSSIFRFVQWYENKILLHYSIINKNCFIFIIVTL